MPNITSVKLCSFHVDQGLTSKENYLAMQAQFRKGRGTSDVIANAHWINEKNKQFKKEVNMCFTDQIKLWNVLKNNRNTRASHRSNGESTLTNKPQSGQKMAKQCGYTTKKDLQKAAYSPHIF